MKQYEKLRRIGNIINLALGLLNLFILTGVFDIPKSIKLYLIFPCLLILLGVSVFFEIASIKMKKKEIEGTHFEQNEDRHR